MEEEIQNLIQKLDEEINQTIQDWYKKVLTETLLKEFQEELNADNFNLEQILNSYHQLCDQLNKEIRLMPKPKDKSFEQRWLAREAQRYIDTEEAVPELLREALNN